MQESRCAAMNNEQKIIETLFANAEKVSHGEVCVILKIHEGRITGVTHSVYEIIKERIGKNENTN
jgi:hypothetical protein